MPKIKTALGLMSGTSIDGIDIALIKSDGYKIIDHNLEQYYPYSPKTRNLLTKLINNPTTSLLEIKQIELEITQNHISVVLDFLTKNNINKEDIDIIGFHGQTILHCPQQKITWQIGNAQMLASEVRINVVADFRNKDIIFDGNGAPLAPIYHLALFKDYHCKPLIILNIGGVANITYIKDKQPENMIAFDVCFGNSPIDDLVKKQTGKNFDKDGKLARSGEINQNLVNTILELDYFKKLPPKSLDRNQFNKTIEQFSNLKIEDILASLVQIIGKSIDSAIRFLPQKPQKIVVCGGGRNNSEIMNSIQNATNIKTINIDDININNNTTIINGDFIEAKAFGFLAIRNILNLPTSYPKTTGISPEKCVPQPSESHHLFSCGGVFYHA